MWALAKHCQSVHKHSVAQAEIQAVRNGERKIKCVDRRCLSDHTLIIHCTCIFAAVLCNAYVHRNVPSSSRSIGKSCVGRSPAGAILPLDIPLCDSWFSALWELQLLTGIRRGSSEEMPWFAEEQAKSLLAQSSLLPRDTHHYYNKHTG